MNTQAVKKTLKVQAVEEEDDEDSDDEAEGDLSEDFGSSDDDVEFYEFDNEVTSNYWVPTEARFFVIYNGRGFVNYNDEQDLVNRQAEDVSGSDGSGSEEEPVDEEQVFDIANARVHSEYMTMRQINNFS